MNRSFFSVCSAFILFASFVHAVPPVLNYAGQVKVDGQAFNGTGHLKFALVSPSGNTTYWSQDGSSVDGGEPSGSVSVQVRGGLYSILLGNTAIDGMGAIDPSLFSTHSDLHLRVWFNDGVNGFERIVPDRPFASVPYALSAGSSNIQSGSITTDQLNEQILKYLRPEITQSPVLTKDRDQVYTGQSITLSSDAEGKFLSYQWLKDGEPVAGATNREFTITDANGSLHNGNYTVQVSNDFGSVSSEVVQIDVKDTRLIHQIDLNSTVSLEMIWVEPGTFTMGSPESEAGRLTNETQHEVTLTNGFYLGKYEVTQAQYEAVMTGNSDGLSATPSRWPNNPDRPVEQVSWDDIQVFLTRLNAQESGNIPEGWAYVLPTEAQWEYACRAGTTTAYSWGDTITTDNANYSDSGYSQTRDVGQYAANPWGFFDMYGNVWEWTSDWYAAYSNGSVTDPEGPASGSLRAFRGGSWWKPGYELRSAYRNYNISSLRSIHLGFRVGFQQIPADVASPEMQIFGDANITHLQDTAWVDPGVEAHDVRDGNITDSITVSGTVDVNTTGTYTLTYTVSDSAGNEASLTRTVNVVEGQASTHTADLNSTVSLEMIWVEPGTFTMGSPESEEGRNAERETQHKVTLSNGFYLGKYEVTEAQYEAVMTGNSDGLSSTPSHWPNNPNRPVEKVSWEDIQKFLIRLNAQEAGNIPEGWAYVLPTEAQWEYACRAGTTTAYSWGDSITADNANYSSSGYSQTRDVGLYDANPWGFFDMHGNVWEWTADWYSSYSSGAVTDPEGPATGSARVVRGGSWLNTGAHLRSAIRGNGDNPSNRYNHIGFRLSLQKVPHIVELNSTVSLEMIWVEPGTFTMGSPESETGREAHETQHEVTLTKGFYLGKYEVTQAQYEAVMSGNSDGLSAKPSHWPYNPNRPVEKVSWDDIQVFLTRLNAQEAGNIPAGWAYVLPTEAQWEYACRAGSTSAYSWGASITTDNANYNNPLGQTANVGSYNVGSYNANHWGFFDMHGNVWEWTADALGAYSSGAQTDPFNAGAADSDRVLRGGSWYDTGSYLRSAFRIDYLPSGREDLIGFRVGFQQQ